MKHILSSAACGILLLATSCGGNAGIESKTVERPFMPALSDTASMRPLALMKLPAGSIKPEGWLLKQLELQRDGLNGHLGEISAWLDRNNNAWLVEGGDRGWEEVPYWLRGYSHLALVPIHI